MEQTSYSQRILELTPDIDPPKLLPKWSRPTEYDGGFYVAQLCAAEIASQADQCIEELQAKLAAIPQWQPIATAPQEDYHRVNLWMDIPASPRSMGIADSFAVLECWRKNGKWVHADRGEQKELYADYITHWMPMDNGPVKS